MFLTHDEIIELTNRRRSDAQRSQLVIMGIEHRVRGDGSIAVLKAHVDKLLGGLPDIVAKRECKPNWEAINA